MMATVAAFLFDDDYRSLAGHCWHLTIAPD
jgi:hypothetical protein